MSLTKYQENEIQALRDRLIEAGMSQRYIDSMVDIKTRHYAGLEKNEILETNQMGQSNLQNEDEIFDTGKDDKKNSFLEAQKQHDLAIDEAPTAAATDFENYKKQNKDRTSAVYSGKGEFKTVLQDYDNPEYITSLNEKMTYDHLKNSDYIQKQVLPSIMNANADVIDKKASELVEKYGITSETSPNNPKYIQAQKEMDILQGKLFYNDKRVQDVITSYSNELGRLHGIDKDGYMVDKHTPENWKALDLKWNTKGLPLSPMSLYNSVFSAGTDVKSVGAAGQAGEYQKTFNKYQSNLVLAQKNNWEDDMMGLENENGDFTHRKDAYQKAAGYKNPISWGEHKEKMSKTIVENEKRYKKDLAEILERRDISSHYERADFDKFASGDNSLRELSLMLTEQGFNMIGAIATLGSLPSVMEGAAIYETRVADRARKMFDLEENEQPTPDQLYQAVLSDTENEDGKVAAETGFAIGMTETASSAFVVGKTGLLMKKGYGSLVKGQYKRFLKNTMKTGGVMVAGGFGEGLTEGIQTAMSSAATGHWSWDEFRQAMGTGAVVGSIIPGGGNVVSSTIKETKATTESIASKWDKNSVENILGAHQKELDIALKKGSISKEEHAEKSNIINDTRKSNEKIPSDFNVKNKKEAINLLTQKIGLQREIDKIGDKALAKGKQDQIAEIDTKLEEVSVRDRFEKQQEKVEKIAGEVFGENVKARNVTSEEAVTMAKEQTKEEYDLINEDLANPNITEEQRKDLNKRKKSIENMIADAETSFGFYDPISKTMVLNKEASVAQGFVTTSSHELLHAILQNTIAESPKIRAELGSALGGYLMKIDPEQIQDSEYAQRLTAYKNAEGNVQAEEMITLFSEALQRGDIKYNESVFTKLKDTFRRLLQKFGKKIEFNTGKDVYNFIKDYNKTIESGKVSKGIKNLALKGADGKLIKPTTTKDAAPVIKQSKEASEKVQSIYEKQGEAGTMDIIDAFKPITNKLVERRSQAPNFDRQLLTDEIETGKRGIFDLIREYDPKSGVPLAAYINKFLPARAIEASQRVLGEEFTQDVSEKIDIAAEEVAVETKTKPVKKKILLSDRLGVKNKVDKAIKEKIPELDIENLSFKTLKDQTPEITGELFGISPKKLISGANITKGELQSAQMFINKNADLLMQMLPEGATAGGTATGVPNTLLKAFYTKTDRAKMAKTGTKAGLAIQQKNNINKKDFLETFGIVDGKPVRTDRNTSARVLALANQTGKMMTNQAVRERLLKEGKPLEAIQHIGDGKSALMFSKNIPKDPEERAELYAKLPEIYDVYLNHGRSMESTFNILFPDMFGLNRKNLIKDFENYVQTYEQAEQIAKETGIPIEKTIEEYITEETQEMDLAANMRGLIGLGKGSIDFRNKEQLQSVRNAVVEIAHKLGWEKADRFLSFLYASGKIGGTRLINDGKGGLEIDPDFEIKKLAKGKTPKKTEGIRYGIFGGVADFKQVVLTGLDGWTEDSKGTILSDAKQSVDVDVSTPALAKVNKDSANRNKEFLVELMDISSELIADGKMSKNDLGMIMMSLSGDMRTPLAAAAHVSHTTSGPISTKTHRYEHILPRKIVGLYLANYAVGNTSKVDINKLLNQFSVAIIPKIQDDIINAVGYKDSMPKDWLLGDSLLKRYFNMRTFGKINLPLIDVTTGNIDKKSEAFTKAYNITSENKKKQFRFSKAINNSRTPSESKGITVLDFDDTLATTKSLVKFTRPDGTTGTLNAEQYANTYEDLLDQGYTFDFSDFNKVVKGKLAPLFNKAMKLQGKFGPDNMFVLTARPPQAAKAIFDFLKANGLNIPIKNITGLANSTAEAKALWIADKVGEGYNDFYFADDALQNVQAVKNMLDQFDVKSKIQQAKVKFSKGLNTEFNNILENVTGIESKKRFSAIKARKRGESKGKFRFFIPPSHEDFVGLLYNFIGKGKQGNAHRDFFERALIRPLNRADRELNTAKQSIANDYKSLNKQFGDVKKKLTKKTPDGDFTYQDAIRVYLWDKHGDKIPGLSPTDQQNLVDLVMGDPELQAYAETLNTISKRDNYVSPTESWEAGDIRTDLDDATGRVGREPFFAEFFENADIIFSQENLNKIEAAYGAEVVSSIKDMLYRIKTGRNRPSGQNKMVNQFLNYLNGSVASTMFFNIRSAVLQQMSMVNFINFGDNNILAAAKAFANQKQYWKDYATIFNSDFMKQRRGGIMTDVNGAELAASVKNATNPVQASIKKLLQLGFLPTQIGDNNAIALGGATYYRNRINTYLKQGLSQKEAEAKAWTDFQVLAEATQQSAKPWMISMQQASPLGKVILAFQNVTSQFNRLGKKAFLDIKNRRISPEYRNASNPQLQSDMSNLSRIAYYFAIQNLIFYSLQSALFMAMFDDDEDDEKFLMKRERAINGSIDSVLRGSGVWGAAIATLKNMAIKWHEQRDKGWNKDESAVLMEMLNVSPPLGIKARKMVNAEKTLNYNKNVIDEMSTFDIENPVWSAVTSYTEATTNVPLNRLYNKTQNVRESLDNQHNALERALMFSGWSKWNLGIGDSEKIKEVKETVKEKKKIESKEKAKIKREEKKKEQEEENKAKIEENKEKSKKDGVCSAISKGGKRCGNSVVPGKLFCTVHEKVKQNETGKKSQCKKIKGDGKRCKMETSSKSGYCYYHD